MVVIILVAGWNALRRLLCRSECHLVSSDQNEILHTAYKSLHPAFRRLSREAAAIHTADRHGGLRGKGEEGKLLNFHCLSPPPGWFDPHRLELIKFRVIPSGHLHSLVLSVLLVGRLHIIPAVEVCAALVAALHQNPELTHWLPPVWPGWFRLSGGQRLPRRSRNITLRLLQELHPAVCKVRRSGQLFQPSNAACILLGCRWQALEQLLQLFCAIAPYQAAAFVYPYHHRPVAPADVLLRLMGGICQSGPLSIRVNGLQKLLEDIGHGDGIDTHPVRSQKSPFDHLAGIVPELVRPDIQHDLHLGIGQGFRAELI
nr:MAG TPA: hypothetical protein [Caudoviricetes sp.]